MFDQNNAVSGRVSKLMFCFGKQVCWPCANGNVDGWSTIIKTRDDQGVLLGFEYTPLSDAEVFYLKQLYPIFWGVLRKVKCSGQVFEYAQLYFDPRAKPSKFEEFVASATVSPDRTVGV